MDMINLKDFIAGLANDKRLHPSHQCLLIVLFGIWQKAGYPQLFGVTRRKLMHLSRIRSTATYHKCISELIAFEYIRYLPTYNHYIGTQIGLNIN